jgi:tRNA-specific 2-thiouridylase
MKEKVLVWLSWWVDSAVTAALLIEQWYDVIAGFMKNYADESNPNCHTREDRNSALQVAKHLWIKVFTIFDFREEYQQTIIDYIVQWYQKWRTPNPDVLCNTKIKFDLFLNYGIDLWCRYVATWHYARIEKNQETYSLLKWKDTNKDQSYFLSGLNQHQLAHSLYPLWVMTKPQVRAYAKKLNLPNADRPDSQWLCFIGKVPMKEFLHNHLPTQKGPIIDTQWTVLWEHDGIQFYTVWQRQWLWLAGGPWFITKRDKDTNTLTVQWWEALDLFHTTLRATNLHRTSMPPKSWASLSAKIRYRQQDQDCTVQFENEDDLLVLFNQPQRAIASGQIIVFYQWDTVIWNATIIEAV